MTASSRIQTAWQEVREGGKSKILSVSAFHKWFMALVNKLNSDKPYPPLANIFVMTLTTHICDHMVNQLGFIIPTRATHGGNHMEIAVLNDAKDVAICAEQALYSILQTVLLVGGRL